MKKSKENDLEGYLWLPLPAFVLIGMGLGFLFNQLPAGLFTGIGLGFLAVVALRIKYKKEFKK